MPLDDGDVARCGRPLKRLQFRSNRVVPDRWFDGIDGFTFDEDESLRHEVSNPMSFIKVASTQVRCSFSILLIAAAFAFSAHVRGSSLKLRCGTIIVLQ